MVWWYRMKFTQWNFCGFSGQTELGYSVDIIWFVKISNLYDYSNAVGGCNILYPAYLRIYLDKTWTLSHVVVGLKCNFEIRCFAGSVTLGVFKLVFFKPFKSIYKYVYHPFAIILKPYTGFVFNAVCLKLTHPKR